jgi:hypothetical protein
MTSESSATWSVRSWVKREWETFTTTLVEIAFIVIVLVFLSVFALPFFVFYFWNTGEGLTKFYLAGVVAYWIRWIILIARNCFRLLSIFDRNMAQIGMRRDIFTGKFVVKAQSDFGHRLALGAFGFFLMSLLSWLVFAIDFFLFIKVQFNKWNTPAEIKAIHWRLRNVLLKPLDVARFDVKAAELTIGRNFTDAEYDEYQQDMDSRGVNVKMADVRAANEQTPS